MTKAELEVLAQKCQDRGAAAMPEAFERWEDMTRGQKDVLIDVLEKVAVPNVARILSREKKL